MEKRFRDLLKNERFLMALALIVALFVSAGVPALESSEADLIEAFKGGLWLAIGGATLSEILAFLYPILVRITERTPDKRDDHALAIAAHFLQGLGLLTLPTKEDVDAAPPAG